MNIKIHARQLEMSEAMRNYAEKHIVEAITTIYKGQAATLDIEFSETVAGREKVCKATVFVPRGKTIVASAEDPNLYAAVDMVAEKISRGLRHYKEKRQVIARQGSKLGEVISTEVTPEDDDALDDYSDVEMVPEPAMI